MFGFGFSIIGFLFALICSFIAKGKNRAYQDWFILGFLFSFLAFGILYLLPEVKEENFLTISEEDEYLLNIRTN